MTKVTAPVPIFKTPYSIDFRFCQEPSGLSAVLLQLSWRSRGLGLGAQDGVERFLERLVDLEGSLAVGLF